jgi:hypothetical protein
MTLEDVLRRRWRATGLPTSSPGAAASTSGEQVRRLGGVQAQEFELTLWSLSRRTGEPRARILDRFERGEFLRTHALRQTWHFVHRDDLTLVQAATSARVHQSNRQQYRQEGLDEATLRRAGDVVLEALADGPRTRAQLSQSLAAAGFEVTGFRVGMLLMWAELECLVVSGPMAGKQHTYRQWPDRALPEAEAARVALAERFFASHGPATIEDFAAWASLTRTAARQAAAALPVERAAVEGVELVWLGDLDDAEWASPQVELLNCYDEYVSGQSAAGKRWLDQAGLWRVEMGAPLHVVMVDGQLAGRWRRVVSGQSVTIDVRPLRPFSAEEVAALDRAATDYGAFLGPSAVVTMAGAG